jgi:DNA polymerase II small subunit
MKSIIRQFSDHGTFVQPEALEYMMLKDNPHEFANFISNNLKDFPFILTLENIKNIEFLKEKTEKKCEENTIEKEQQSKILTQIYKGEIINKDITEDIEEDEEEQILFDKKKVKSKNLTTPIVYKSVNGWKPAASEYDSEIKILKDVTGKSLCEGTTKDFTKLFLNRYYEIKKIIKKQRREMINLIPLNRIKKSSLKDINIIGIIKDLRTTKNGHKLLEIEDETGSATAIVLRGNRELNTLSNEIIIDEVIGLRCQLSKDGDLLIVNNIVYPDISIKNQKNKSQIPICAAFLSDIHIGSKQFMDAEWRTFLKWINGDLGNSRQRDIAGKIKYLIIPGDVVEGIGIYPNQEKELSIIDVYRQYEVLALQLQNIPNHISILMQPGNHDAVRPAEPQPTFEKEIQDLFSGKDITFIGNPCYFSINNVEILSYHGQSLLDFSTNIKCLKYNEPIEIMKMMLRKHHLAPAYGGYTPLAPEHIDYMVIDKIPDIFVTGHVHLATIGEYRGVTLINASSWQSQTSYQKMLNFVPDAAKVPIAELQTGNVTMMDFKNSNF